MRGYWQTAAIAIVALTSVELQAQTFSTGQTVYASPSGAASDWYSGCVVQDGRSNASFQVECGGTVYWISGDHIRTSPPPPVSDPMRPGQMVAPTITPTNTPGANRSTATAGTIPRASAATETGSTYRQINGGVGPGSYARAQTQPPAARGLKVGHYPCWAGKTPAGFSMNIRSASSYDDGAGHAGNLRYDVGSGKLTFTSGPYTGWASIVYGDGSIGLSQPGRNNYGTQCYPG